MYHKIQKTCEYGAYQADLFVETYNQNAYAGIIFRLSDTQNYLTFELGSRFCRLRKSVNGKIERLATNQTCGYKREEWYRVIIQIEDTGIIKVYGGNADKKLRQLLAVNHQPQVSRGKFGFSTFNTSAAFTNIETMPNRDFTLPELAADPTQF